MNNIDIDLSLTAIMLIVVCEMVLLTFLYFISRFYELKFGQKTFSSVFIIAVALLLVLLGVAIIGLYYYEALIVANLLTLGVIAIFGTHLFRLMTGVTK
jgi:hypothetical protein